MGVTDNPYRAAVRTKMLTNCQLWFKHHHREFWQPTCILSHSSLFLAFSTTIFFFLPQITGEKKKTDPTLSNNKCTFKILGSIKSNTQSNSGARQGKQQPYDLSSITERILHPHMAKVSTVAGWTRVRLWRWETSYFFAQLGVVLQTHPSANVRGMADRHLVH